LRCHFSYARRFYLTFDGGHKKVAFLISAFKGDSNSMYIFQATLVILLLTLFASITVAIIVMVNKQALFLLFDTLYRRMR